MYPGASNVADPVNQPCKIHTAESILPPEPEDPNDMVVDPENPAPPDEGQTTDPENPEQPANPDGAQTPTDQPASGGDETA